MPAAAKMPDCRMPPPSILRQRLPSLTNSLPPSNTDPTGAPSPLDKQTDTESKHPAISFAVTPE